MIPPVFSADKLEVVELNRLGDGAEKVRSKLAFDDLGFLQLETFQTHHFSLMKARYNLKRDVVVHRPHEHNSKTFMLTAMSHGQVCATFLGKEHVKASDGIGGFNYNPVVEEKHLLYSNVPGHTTALEISADYVLRLLFEQEENPGGHLTLLKQKILQNEFVNFPYSVSAVHHRILSDIDNCPLTGSFANLMLEGSLQQLLALQFSLLSSPQYKRENIHSRDRDILHAVREHLTDNFNDEHSISGLSRQFGINQTKLKKYFNELFGVPVIQYVFDLKMGYAKKLLCDKDLSVREVAHLIGYKNANHFSTAFKKKFGISPLRLKK